MKKITLKNTEKIYCKVVDNIKYISNGHWIFDRGLLSECNLIDTTITLLPDTCRYEFGTDTINDKLTLAFKTDKI